MHDVEELIDTSDPAWSRVGKWLDNASNPVDVLAPPAEGRRRSALHATQVTTRSSMGAIVYETGGVLVDSGWIRVMGARHPRLPRTLPDWNLECDVSADEGFYLVADDVLGGFFALNGGGLASHGIGDVFYFAPDCLEWEPLNMSYSEFIRWLAFGDMGKFYEGYRWRGWRDEVRELPGDKGYSIFPFLWTGGPGIGERSRQAVRMKDLWKLQQSQRRQMLGDGE